MPGMLGDDLVREIRRRWPRVRVALISVISGEELTQRARSAGAEWVLSKPITVSLMQRVIVSATVRGARTPWVEQGWVDR